MRLSCLLVVLSCLPLTLVTAQQKLTLDEAIKLGLENNIEIKRQSATSIESEIDLNSASTLPNPVLSYSREDLNSGDSDYAEWSVSGAIPINFIWERWSNMNSKHADVEVQKLILSNTRWNVSSEIKQIYSLLNTYSTLHKHLSGALEKITELSGVSKERVIQGDISEYESQRILLELNRFKTTLKNVELKKLNYETTLKLLTGINATEIIHTDTSDFDFVLRISKQDLIQIALKNRSDLIALRLNQESGNSYLTYTKLKALPEISILAGYKSQTDNLTGTVVEVNLQIPLFNRNQTGIERAELELNLNHSQIIHLENKIISDVSELYDHYMATKEIYIESMNYNPESLFETAHYSYEQGESTLVEFLDGMNAFIDGLIMTSEIKSDLTIVFYKLQRATEASLNNEEF